MAVPPRIAPESSSPVGRTKHRTLVLVRHGHAVQGADDKLRPLSDEGRRQLAQTAVELKTLIPQRLLCSSATRTRQSAEILRTQSGVEAELELQSALYLASPQVILDWVMGTSPAVEVCWVVGHNPGLSELVRLLSQTPLELNTSETAVLLFNGEWRDLRNCPCTLSGDSEVVAD